MVRGIICMTLSALRSLLALHIVHTGRSAAAFPSAFEPQPLDVKLDDILFSNARFALASALEKYLEQNPARVDPNTQVPGSQPIPHEWSSDTTLHEAERMTFVLIDQGHGEGSETIWVCLTKTNQPRKSEASHSGRDSVPSHYVHPRYCFWIRNP